MSDLYHGLPPPISISQYSDSEFKSELNTEIKRSDKKEEKFSSWGKFIETFIETTKNSESQSTDIIDNNKHKTQDVEDSDPEYDPRIPNIYDQIVPSKEVVSEIKPTTSIENKKEPIVNLLVGKKLLEKMGWKQGEGLGKNKQGIINPISIVQKFKK